MNPSATDEKIIIRDTVDGQPVKEVNASTRRKPEAPAKRRRGGDTYIWGVYLCLVVISIVELYSASSSEVTGSNVYAPLIRHCIFLAAGFVIILGCQRVHYSVFRKLALPLAVLTLVLLGLCMVMGVEINNAQRAISVAGMTIQPPEIAKVTVVLLLASVLAKHQILGGVSTQGIVKAALIVIIAGVLVLPNGLTNMLILGCASLCMFIIGGIKFSKIGMVLAVYVVAGGMAVLLRSASSGEKEFDSVTATEQTAQGAGAAVSASETPNIGRLQTQINRVKRHLAGVSPNDTMNDLNRQVMFSMFAQAHGGIINGAPGKSIENSRLPLAFSDYIYAIIVEDTGLVGGLCLLILYLFLLARAGVIASKCSRAFPAVLIMGCALLIVLQALIHMAIVTGLAPVSGQPLPLISKGGTSILVMSFAIGMMLSVSSTGIPTGTERQQKAEISALPEDIKAANPLQRATV